MFDIFNDFKYAVYIDAPFSSVKIYKTEDLYSRENFQICKFKDPFFEDSSKMFILNNNSFGVYSETNHLI